MRCEPVPRPNLSDSRTHGDPGGLFHGAATQDQAHRCAVLSPRLRMAPFSSAPSSSSSPKLSFLVSISGTGRLPFTACTALLASPLLMRLQCRLDGCCRGPGTALTGGGGSNPMGAPALLTRVAFGNSILFLAIGSTPVGCSVRLRSLPALAAWHICSVAALIRHCCMCFLRPGVFNCLVAPARAARVQPGLPAIVLRAVPCPNHRLIEHKAGRPRSRSLGPFPKQAVVTLPVTRNKSRAGPGCANSPAAPLCALMPATLGWPAPFAGVRALSTSCPQLCDSHSTPAPPSSHRRLPASCGRGARPICSICELEPLVPRPGAALSWCYRITHPAPLPAQPVGAARTAGTGLPSARPGRGRRPGAMAAGAAPGAVGGGAASRCRFHKPQLGTSLQKRSIATQRTLVYKINPGLTGQDRDMSSIP